MSDTFCIDRHRDGFNALIDERRIDILFANEAEIAAAGRGAGDFESAVEAVARQGRDLGRHPQRKGALATRGGERAEVPAEPIARLVDTTGAGDLFAAGFLAGEARGLGLEQSLKLGAIAAAEVIQHYGARPEADLRALAGDVAGLGPNRSGLPLSVAEARPRGISRSSPSAVTGRPLASSELCMP